MSTAKQARPASKPAKPRPPRSPGNIARAAVAHEGKTVPGGRVKLRLTVTLSRAQAERLTARAIAEGKNLNALVAGLLEAVLTEPRA